jgi:hypothetical protein
MLISYAHGNASGNTGYVLTLLNQLGQSVASAMAAARSFIPGNPSEVVIMPLPEVSASSTRAYYLDGDKDIHYLAPDGRSGLVTRVPGSTTAYAAFAVSPDDSQIAVSVFDFSKRPIGVRLYVENIDGSSHVDLFASTTDYVWPVGWHAKKLVLAASQITPYAVVGNPYGAPSYHLVDPTTAARSATLGGDPATGCAPQGPLTKAGTACWTLPTPNGPGFLSMLDWSGHESAIRLQVSGVTHVGALSPDGSQLAACCDAQGHVSVEIPGGTIFATELTGQDGVCWLDSGHLYSGPESPSDGVGQILDLRKNMDDPAGAISQLSATGYCAGMLPQDFG